MRKSFLFLCLCILVLAGCKKESSEVNRSAVSIIVLPVETDGVISSGYNYKLKAMIVSPGAVDVEDHGFMVFGGGTSYMTPVPLGAAKIAGGIESDFPSALPPEQFSVVAYAKLKNGDMIYSVGYTPDTPPTTSASVEIASPGHTTAAPGYETFTGDIFNYDVARYQIIEVGIEYAEATVYAGNGGNFTDYHAEPYSGTQASPIPFFLQIPTGTIFPKSTTYHYRTYVTVLDLATTNTSKVTDTTNGALTFTSQ